MRVTKDFLTFCFKAGSVLEKYDICLKAINYSRDINKQAGFESQDRSRLFQFRIALKLFLLGVRLFLKMSNRTVSTLPSSFLFPINIYHEKEQLIQKEFHSKNKRNPLFARCSVDDP